MLLIKFVHKKRCLWKILFCWTSGDWVYNDNDNMLACKILKYIYYILPIIQMFEWYIKESGNDITSAALLGTCWTFSCFLVLKWQLCFIFFSAFMERMEVSFCRDSLFCVQCILVLFTWIWSNREWDNWFLVNT